MIKQIKIIFDTKPRFFIIAESQSHSCYYKTINHGVFQCWTTNWTWFEKISNKHAYLTGLLCKRLQISMMAFSIKKTSPENWNSYFMHWITMTFNQSLKSFNMNIVLWDFILVFNIIREIYAFGCIFFYKRFILLFSPYNSPIPSLKIYKSNNISIWIFERRNNYCEILFGP